jgi:S-formylglutathione hydrolase FrmB
MRVLALGLLGGCLYTRAAVIPMPFTEHPSPERARGVVVFLPGLGDDPALFVDHGFVTKVNGRGYDAVTVDAHFGYYRDRILKPRLDEDVMSKLAARYERIWLVGISLGGFGSIAYAVEHQDRVAGIVALAPFLGEEDAFGDVERAGGLGPWDPGDPTQIEDRDERAFRELWAWLSGYAKAQPRPPLYLGYGDRDRFVRSSSLIARALPEAHVEVQPGGHDWKTWKPVFEALIDRALADPRGL